MLALLSPAKKLDFDSDWKLTGCTKPTMLKHSKELVEILKGKSQKEIKSLMKLSDKLAELNHNRYKEFTTPFTNSNARPAISAFRGDTYVGLDADTLAESDIKYAQDHLRIISGLYGLLRPLDLMQAYRLEMGTKLANKKGKDLYEFWGDILTKSCNEIIKDHKDKTVISLASNEYIKAINPSLLEGEFVTCHFKEVKNGQPKVVGLFAKRARGMMARFIVKSRIETAKELKAFKEDGYKFMTSLSDMNNYVFTRE